MHLGSYGGKKNLAHLYTWMLINNGEYIGDVQYVLCRQRHSKHYIVGCHSQKKKITYHSYNTYRKLNCKQSKAQHLHLQLFQRNFVPCFDVGKVASLHLPRAQFLL